MLSTFLSLFSVERRVMRVIKKALPAVVSISASKDINTLSHISSPELFPVFNKDKKRAKKLATAIEGESVHVSGGSGFIIDPSGIVVTNIHVIADRKLDWQVITYDGVPYPATLVGTDYVNDVAFLKIQATLKKQFRALPIGDSSLVTLGQTVLAIGNVLGLFRNTVSAGIVSGLFRSIEAENDTITENLHGLIQTDAAINPGNSGGPLIDLRGHVIGINSASVTKAENIGFALPINVIRKDLARLKREGVIRRPFLGVRYIILDRDTQHTFKTPVCNGALVMSPTPGQQAVIPKSPADIAGLKEKDIIIRVNKKLLANQHTLQDALEDVRVGSMVTLTIIRKGKIIDLRATMKEER